MVDILLGLCGFVLTAIASIAHSQAVGELLAVYRAYEGALKGLGPNAAALWHFGGVLRHCGFYASGHRLIWEVVKLVIALCSDPGQIKHGFLLAAAELTLVFFEALLLARESSEYLLQRLVLVPFWVALNLGRAAAGSRPVGFYQP